MGITDKVELRGGGIHISRSEILKWSMCLLRRECIRGNRE